MLQWDWEQKIGEVEILNNDKIDTYTLYQGNAFLIMLYEYEEDGKDMYKMSCFLVDEAHAKRVLGIDKKYKKTYGENCFDKPNYKMQKIRIKKSEYSYTKKLVDMLIEAFDELTIELY